MFTSEFFENIRMGYKDISHPTKKNYTYGVELEIIVSDDVFDENTITEDLISYYADGKSNSYVRQYIESLIDDNIWNSAKSVEDLIAYFEKVSKAKLKNGAKIQRVNDTYVISHNAKKARLESTEMGYFVRLVTKYYDFSNLAKDKKFIEFLKKMIKKLINNNRYTYVLNSKIKYLEKVMQDTMDIEKIEPDSSVPQGGEVVSKVYDDLNTFLSDLKIAFKRIQEDKYLSTDMTTGLHINIGTWDRNEIYKLDVLKFFLIADTMGILKDFDRVGSDYAVPVGNKLKNAVSDLNIQEYNDISKNITAKILSSADKFDDINFSKLPYDGYIEVRGFGNADYEKRFPEIKTHILKLVRVLDITQDPNAYKNDYMKKLTKFLDKNVTKESGLSDIQNEILKDLKRWGKPANRNAYTYDVETIEDMARWIRSFIESSRSNSSYLKKIGETMPPNLSLNVLRYISQNMKSGSIAFKHELGDARNMIQMTIHEYYLEEESPKLEKTLKRIFKI
jgi:hypothetical protein